MLYLCIFYFVVGMVYLKLLEQVYFKLLEQVENKAHTKKVLGPLCQNPFPEAVVWCKHMYSPNRTIVCFNAQIVGNLFFGYNKCQVHSNWKTCFLPQKLIEFLLLVWHIHSRFRWNYYSKFDPTKCFLQQFQTSLLELISCSGNYRQGK